MFFFFFFLLQTKVNPIKFSFLICTSKIYIPAPWLHLMWVNNHNVSGMSNAIGLTQAFLQATPHRDVINERRWEPAIGLTQFSLEDKWKLGGSCSRSRIDFKPWLRRNHSLSITLLSLSIHMVWTLICISRLGPNSLFIDNSGWLWHYGAEHPMPLVLK